MKGNGKNIQELTRIEAYLLSEKAGHPSHMHDYFWAQAEAIVRQRATVVAVAVKTTGKKTVKSGKPAKVESATPPAKKPPAKGKTKTAVPKAVAGVSKKPAPVATKAKGKAKKDV